MLDELSFRPHLIRAVYQWCSEKRYTPYILARVESEHSTIPPQHINDGRVVLNISSDAVRSLVINDDGVFFTARFLGKTVEVFVAMADVLAVYAREVEKGIFFPDLSGARSTVIPEDQGKAAVKLADKKNGRKMGRNLRII